jgi:putative component of membrane protein insertase Oxa1/YidC/SpoIIIJ protein YidD
VRTSGILLLFLLAASSLADGYSFTDSMIVRSMLDAGSSDSSLDSSHVVKGDHRPGILGLLLSFYKKFISSQDGETCSFNQSCSHFSAWAVREKGLFTGVLLTADRLTRCNGIKPDRYKRDSISGKNIDDYPDLLK